MQTRSVSVLWGWTKPLPKGRIAQAYLRRHQLGEEALAEVTAQAWAQARLNPYLGLQDVPGLDQINASPFAAAPLRQSMLARPVDGAVAMVLASEIVDPAFETQWSESEWPAPREWMAALLRTRTRDSRCEILEGTDACVAPVLTGGVRQSVRVLRGFGVQQQTRRLHRVASNAHDARLLFVLIAALVGVDHTRDFAACIMGDSQHHAFGPDFEAPGCLGPGDLCVQR